MIEKLIIANAVVLIGATIVAYSRTRDILHPLMFLGPLFFYATVIDPWIVRNDLDLFFKSPEDIIFVLSLYFASVVALAFGTLTTTTQRHLHRRTADSGFPVNERASLRNIASVVALAALSAYALGIMNAGGFVAAFSQVKGGGRSVSGYISEAMNLGLVAAAMASITQRRRGWDGQTLALLVLGVLPNLIQGTFGGRRGPLFMCLMTVMLGWLITRRKPPRLATMACSFALIMFAVAFAWSQRQHLHLGSNDTDIRWDQFVSTLAQADVDKGNNFVYGAGFVVTTFYSDQYTWGRELAVNLFVRPIPRQLWPTKYQDVGATWVTSRHPGLGHLSISDWMNAVGWIPLAGSSAVSITDLFGEFGWGTVIVMYLVGRGFAFLWLRRQTRSGVWELLYLEALTLSIYLATQSFAAFYHRFLILGVPTVVAWKLIQRDKVKPVAHLYRPDVLPPIHSFPQTGK